MARLSLSLQCGMTDIEADGVGSALWKDLGSGSDMAGECKMVDQVMAKSQIDLSHHGVALVTSIADTEDQLMGSCLGKGYSMSKVYAENDLDMCCVFDKEMARNLEIRDISITERVRFWVLCDGECKMLEQGYGEAWVTSMFQVERAIQFQDYSEAIVVSMLILEFQATGPR
ncbi:Disks Large-like 4 [Manis pentadactyla]|nr:Disks Large-like 4 [Manis pentadactyla]